MSSVFNLQSDYQPAGDQPKAIEGLTAGLSKGFDKQTLLGVTGSGKTFTVANTIANYGKPTLVIAHNKTLAAQLAQEYRSFFPDHAVHYFVSYYDYYQPEAYVPASDTYIEKEAQINEEIDRLRHAATQALLTRRDVIIVASVSCIYGLGSPENYEREHWKMVRGMPLTRQEFIRHLTSVFYERTTTDLAPTMFRAVGNRVEVMPANERAIYRFDFAAGELAAIVKLDPVSQVILGEPETFFLFPAKHFITDKDELNRAIKNIKAELEEQLAHFDREGKVLEADRLRRRTNQDIAMLREVGYCHGIENYSRHLSGRAAGVAPDTLLSYFPRTSSGAPDFLTVIDESHVTIPQIGGMYAGDASRKKTLVEHGFRLPSALDNRPLTFEEFEARTGETIYTSATPAEFERKESKQVVEQIIRPTGLVDPELIVRPVTEDKESAYGGQVNDFIDSAEATIKDGGRVIVTTLTKKMAEDLSEFLKERGIKAEYVHSEVKTIDRITILSEFRKGKFDCLVGVNLLREGLDLPEVVLIGILDADKEGFLRSETSLIQIIGRAARNIAGRVILYADRMTGALESAIAETNRRREIQLAYNEEHGITPQTVKKSIHDITEQLEQFHDKAVDTLLSVDRERYKKEPKKVLKEKEARMNEAVKMLDFETAAIIRDEILALKEGGE